MNEAHPNIVIEASLSNSPRQAEVRLTKTGSYFGTDSLHTVSSANIFIETETGTRFNLVEVEKGLYRAEKIIPVTGKTYKLTVESNGEIYTSESMLNPPIKIDSLALEYNNGTSFFDKGYNVHMYFRDPPEVKNYYRLKIYVNNKLENSDDDYILFDDENINGQFIQLRIRTKTYEVGDNVRYELISLDRGAFIYFSSLEELIHANPGSAAPANPISNMTNGALGYFSAWSSDKRNIIIKE